MKLKLFILTYILIGVSAFGQIISSPTATPNPICEGSTLNLTANPTGGTAPYSYNWTGPAGFTSNLQNPTVTNITIAKAGVYKLIVTDSLGTNSIIESTTSVVVTLKIIPTFETLLLSYCRKVYPPLPPVLPILPIPATVPIPVLPNTSTEGIDGAWSLSPVNDNPTATPLSVDTDPLPIGPLNVTKRYYFYPNASECATNTFVDIVITRNALPTFSFPLVYCVGDVVPNLPLNSTNSVGGTWSNITGAPLVKINTTVAGTFQYNFSPTPGLCALQTAVIVTIKPISTPSFNLPSFICINGVVPVLPTQSTNLPPIVGTWNPAIVSNIITKTYVFTPSAGVGICASNYSLTININPIITPITTFNYPSPVCKNASNPAPNTVSGFTTGGVYSSTSGLVFVSTASGVIDLNASTVGTFTVTYTVTADPTNCKLGGTSTATITINPIVTPVTGFSYASPICRNSVPNPLPILNSGFATGGTFSSTAGLVFANTSTGEINLNASTAGTYTITYNISANAATCQIPGTNAAVIVIKPEIVPVSGFSYNSPICQTQGSTILNPILVSGFTPGGTFTSSTGLIINATTGAIDLTSAAATYTVTYTIIANATNCFTTNSVSTSQITINPLINPVTGFSYISPICKNATPNPSPILISGFTTTGTFSSTPGLVFVSNTTGQINLSASTSGVYVVTYNVTAIPANCQIAGTNSATIEIKNNVVPVGGFSYTSPICKTNITLNPSLATGFTLGGIFASTSGLDISSSSGAINIGNSLTGTYTVTYTITANSTNCFTTNSTTTAQITINTTIVPVDGFSYTTPICQTQTSTILNPILVSGFTSGGVFTSTSGLILNATTGAINLTSVAGTYSVSYTITANSVNCFTTNSVSTAQIIINPIVTPITSFSYTSPICKNSTPNPSPVLNTGFTTGGTFTSTTGLNFISNTTGQINLATSTPGIYTVTYNITSIPASCQLSGSNTAVIEIKPAVVPNGVFGYTTPVCQTQTSTIITPNLGFGFTSGGTFTSTTGLILNGSSGAINLTSVAGTYTVTYSIVANSTNCFTTDLTSTAQITINPIIIPVTVFTYPTPICKNSLTIMSPTLTSGFTTGGIFSSTSGLDINGTTGLINLSNSTAGTYVVIYNTLVNTTTCQLAGLSTFVIVINPIVTPVVSFSYVTPICKNALVNPNPILASGFVTGGVFSSTANLDVDPVTGIINLANSNVGTYVVTYNLVANPALCRLAGSSTTTITINTVINPVPNFSYVTPVCKNAGTANIVQGTGFTFGGVFSSTSGLSINSATGIIDLAASTAGSYTVNYVITANATNCFSANSSSSAAITISPSTNSVTGFSYTSPVCKNAINASPNLVTGFTLGGTFSSTTGLSINALTGLIDLNASTIGTYTVTYTYLNNVTNCITAGTNTATITINPTVNAVTGFSYNTPFCKNDANPNPIFVAGYTTGGIFTSTAGLSISATTGIIDLQASNAGTYVINYAVLANTSTCLLAGNSTATVTINPMVSAVTTFSYTSPVCKLGANPVPNTSAAGFTTGGTFSSTNGLSINSSTGIINLAASTAGTYIVTYNTLPNLATCLLAGNGTTIIVITADITAVTNFTYATPICKNTTNQSPVLPTGFSSGGTFSSTAGLSISTTTGIINVASSTIGTYTINYNVPINLATCTNSGNNSFQITITPVAAAVTTISYPTTICKNDLNPTPNTSAAGFTTGGTYVSTTGLSINPSTGVINLAASTSGIYTITYSVNPNTTACIAGGSSSYILTITEPLIPTFTAINTSICLNGAVQTLPTVFVSGVAVTGTWTPALVTSNTVGNTDYTFNYTNAICANKPKITVNIFAPTLVPTFPTILLSVCYKSSVQTLPTRSFEGIDGTWLPATVSNTETKTYEFTPNSGLCALKKSITITVIPELLSEFKTECLNANYLLSVLPINNSFNSSNSTYQWTKVGSAITIATMPTLNVTNILNGSTPIYPLVYSVKITSNGCSSSTTFSIDNVYCEIQKGISPNGDKKNDYFDLSNFEVKQLEVFNRYGIKVYAKSDYKNEWEGQTDDGTTLPDGTYFYNIEFNNNDVKTGWIYINKETN